jgi:predicted nucleic acid-binding Zn ribbon protein
MNPELSRTCPFCAEAIPLAAKVCPRCRQWLKMRSFRHPITNFVVLILPLVLLCGLMVSLLMNRLDDIINPRPFFGDMPDSLRVIEASMNWVETTNGPRIYVVGMLTNQSSVAWKDLEIQCRFFDTNGVMVDAEYPSSRLTILPHGDAAFRGLATPSHAEADYHTLKATVSAARNARSRF